MVPAPSPGGRVVRPGFHERVFAVVARVPRGFVTTYGDVAEALGSRSVARHVGFALAALPRGRSDVPWHRVVAAGGRIAHADPVRQRRLLIAEGVPVRRGIVAGFEARRVPRMVLTAIPRGRRS